MFDSGKFESALHLRYDAGCQATHLYAYAVKCDCLQLRHYQPVVTEFNFQVVSFLSLNPVKTSSGFAEWAPF